MLSCYKYGIPTDMPEEEVKKLREKIDKMQREFDVWLKDPKEQRKVAFNARIAGTLRPCDLAKQFTI